MLYTLIGLPDYSTVVNSTTSAFATSLMADLLPWAGALAILVMLGLALLRIRGAIVGAFAKAIGVKKRGGRRGRRR